MPTTLDDLTWPLATERLTLRRGQPADAGAVWAYRSLPEVEQWITRRAGTPEEFAEQFTRPDRLGPTLVVELDGRLVGDVMIRVEDQWAQDEVAEGARGVQAEVGWIFDPAFHGRGLATETVLAMLTICFEQLGLHRVVALCFAENEPSWRLMERVGFRREACFVADSLHRDGLWHDALSYAMLDTEWRERSR